MISNSRESLNNNTLIGPSLNSSFGNIQYPQNFNLIPEFKIANIFQNHFASSYYLILSIIFYFAVYFLMSTISNLPLLSTITAFVFVIITLPFFGIPIISDIYWWQFSYFNTGMYVTCIFFAVYIKLLAQHTKKSIILLVLVLFLWLYIYAVTPAQFPWLLPALVLFIISTTIVTSRNLKFYIFLGLQFILIFLLLWRSSKYWISTGNYTLSTSLNPLAFFYPLSIENLWMKLGTYWSPFFSLISLISSICIVSVKVLRKYKLIALYTLITFIFFVFPSMGAIYAAQILFCYLICTLIVLNHFITKVKIFNYKILKSSFFVVISLSLIYQSNSLIPSGFGYQSNSSDPLVLHLENKLQFKLNDKFNGRFHNLIDLSKESYKLNTFELVNRNGAKNFLKYGNDRIYAGPIFKDIPVAAEDNRASTVASILFHRSALNNSPLVKERVDFRYVNSNNLDWLEFIGVKYILVEKNILTKI